MPRILLEAARLKFGKRLRYYDRPIPSSAMTIRRPPPTLPQKVCMKVLTGLLGKITTGGIRLALPDGKVLHFGDRSSPLQGEIVVNDYRFFSDSVLGGDVGLGESYMAGTWDTKDIAALFRVFIRNKGALANGYPATAWLRRRKNQILHFLRANTLTGSRRNIRSHYDLSNDFFRLFLDRSMTYSCGVYYTDGDTLEDAQRNKLERIIRKGEITESDHVLEIGCGWGGFAVAAAKGTGCRVTGITVSEAQHRFAVDRVNGEGLQDRVTIALTDYRQVKGLFDKIVSIEMLEAVGHKYFGTFFNCCERLLKPGGLLVIQVITTPDQEYREYLRETGFCQKHIFPGGSLPSVTALCEAATKASGFVMDSLEEIGRNYSRTLHEWHRRFHANLPKVAALGFDRPFQRKWAYYLATCEAGFTERAIGDIQVVFRKPG